MNTATARVRSKGRVAVVSPVADVPTRRAAGLDPLDALADRFFDSRDRWEHLRGVGMVASMRARGGGYCSLRELAELLGLVLDRFGWAATAVGASSDEPTDPAGVAVNELAHGLLAMVARLRTNRDLDTD